MADDSNRRPLASRQTGWAAALTRILAATSVTPNQISMASMVMAAVSGALPTRAFARARAAPSIGPDGGTPTSHRPVRPGRSWTVVSMPGRRTSSTRSRPARCSP